MHWRTGLTPVITAVLLVAMVIGLGTSTYYFVLEQQETVVGTTKTPNLETVNLSCQRNQVDWWLENTEAYGVDPLEGDIYFTEDGTFNSTLHRSDEPLPPALQQGNAQAKLSFRPNKPLATGQDYDLSLETSDAETTATCTVGSPWWDVNWDYRRPIPIDSGNLDASGTTRIQLNTTQMVHNGALQPYCQDIRIVIDGTAVSHQLDPAPGQCADATTMNVQFAVNNVPAAQGTTYVYYGNPTAPAPSPGSAGTPPISPTGPEETSNVR